MPDPARVRAALQVAAADPQQLTDDDAEVLLAADGDDLDELAAIADARRRERVGDALTFVVNRNLDPARVGAGTAASRAHVRALVVEAARLGATEVCLQGPLPPGAPADGALDLVRTVAQAVPGVHVHAFRPAEVAAAAQRAGTSPRAFLQRAREAGLGSVPGTAAKVLDDGVRAALNGGRPDLPVARWLELVTTAHEVGLTSTATMVYGHVESAAQQVAHLRLLARTAERTGGFTEFIPMPFTAAAGTLPQPLPAGARRGPSVRETRAVHAVARLLLDGRIDHVQAAWPKLGLELSEVVLRGGADDAGGLLLDGALDPAAGQEAGSALSREDVEALAARLGRVPRQRTTRYGDPVALPV